MYLIREYVQSVPTYNKNKNYYKKLRTCVITRFDSLQKNVIMTYRKQWLQVWVRPQAVV